MADRAISQLTQATAIQTNDAFVLEQSGEAKQLKGSVLGQWLINQIDGHGGIVSFVKISTSGLVDTWRMTYFDNSHTDITVTNGAKGDKGDKGNTGAVPKQSTTYNITYGISESSQTEPTTWGTMPGPTELPGKYLWEKMIISYTNTTDKTTLKFPLYQGSNGTGSLNTVDNIQPVGGNINLPKDTEAPVQNSTKYITSGAVYTAVANGNTLKINCGTLSNTTAATKTVSTTISNLEKVTASMETVYHTIGNPTAFASNITVTTASKKVTVSASMKPNSSSTIVVYLATVS